MRFHRLAVIVPCLWLSLVACGDDDEGTKADADTTAETSTDATTTDATVATDTSVATDGSTTVPNDTSGGEDTTVVGDTTVEQDTSVEQDTTVADDTQVGEDTSISDDTQVGEDTLVAQDTSVDDTTVAQDTAEPAPEVVEDFVTFDEVHPIFRAKCVGCHATPPGSGGHTIAHVDVATAYASSQTNADVCAGKKIGECAMIRINNGSMPLGGNCGTNPNGAACLTADQKALIQAWIDDGMRGPANSR